MPKKGGFGYTEEAFNADMEALTGLLKSFQGGAKHSHKGGKGSPKQYPHRTFQVHTVNGKKVNFESKSEINKNPTVFPQTPLNAAERVYPKLCEDHLKLKGDCTIVFTLRETTRGYKFHNKIYGPYEATTKKLKKAKIIERNGKKIKVTRERIVRKQAKSKGGYSLY